MDEAFYQPYRMYEISMPKVKEVGPSGMRMAIMGKAEVGGNFL